MHSAKVWTLQERKKTGYVKEDGAGEINGEKNSIRKLYSGMRRGTNVKRVR
jgi:hypothetical protein